MQEDKKFKPEQKPFKQNAICSLYRVTDQKNQKYFAKFFVEKKVEELNIFQSTEYNQTVLSDLEDQVFPESFLKIKYTYSIPQGFIFVTDPYQNTLEVYLKSKVIQEKQAMQVFQQLTKAVFSLHSAGFWHRNIRPQHFVKVGNTWKMESMVYNQHYKDAEGIQSEFIWNPAYQPPEAYRKDDFSEEELDQMMVWNMGSILLDLLLSHHKLKDQTILNKYKNKQFTLKAIGVKKNFSDNINRILGKMLHYNPKQRMKISQYFSDETICPQVAKLYKKNESKKARIYTSGQSSLSKSLSVSSERAQEILTVKDFSKQKLQRQNQIKETFSRKNQEKLESQNQLINTIKRLTIQNNKNYQFNTISQVSIQQSSINSSRVKRFSDLLLNPKVSKAVEIYKCYYDKCQLLMIAIGKLQNIQYNQNVVQALLLNKFAITYVSLMHLHILAESMNQNLNFFQLEPQLWSQFQSSNQFKGFKQIINYKRTQRRNLLNPLRERIALLKAQQRKLMKKQQIEDFIHTNYKTASFQQIKMPYRKILKHSYDIITREYNNNKTIQLARTGMYITYCMTIDKLYLPEEIHDNFKYYFKWMNIPSTEYVPVDQFQDYLDNAQKKTLVAHSIYILKKYFYV